MQIAKSVLILFFPSSGKSFDILHRPDGLPDFFFKPLERIFQFLEIFTDIFFIGSAGIQEISVAEICSVFIVGLIYSDAGSSA